MVSPSRETNGARQPERDTMPPGFRPSRPIEVKHLPAFHKVTVRVALPTNSPAEAEFVSKLEELPPVKRVLIDLTGSNMLGDGAIGAINVLFKKLSDAKIVLAPGDSLVTIQVRPNSNPARRLNGFQLHKVFKVEDSAVEDLPQNK